MPDREVKTIRDLIYYQYAKIISKRAFDQPDGKSTKGLYTFYQSQHPEEKKFYDIIPVLLEKKYLKTIYNCHECAETLDKVDLNGDEKITVSDIDCIIH
ncbi:MAG: hypothetical protein PHF84_06440 [bacterium]|nr:hypothetical protein [bacterium]